MRTRNPTMIFNVFCLNLNGAQFEEYLRDLEESHREGCEWERQKIIKYLRSLDYDLNEEECANRIERGEHLK